MKESTKKYLTVSLCLFASLALAIILYFVLYKIDAINSVVSHIFKTMMPFIVGIILAYILYPLCNRLEVVYGKLFEKVKNEMRKAKLIQTFSVFSSIIIALIVVYIILMVIIPHLISSIVTLVNILPESANKLINYLDHTLTSHPEIRDNIQDLIDKGYKEAQNWLNNEFLKQVQIISTSIMGFFTAIFNLFVGIIVAVYLLLGRKKLARQANLICYSIFRDDIADKLDDEVEYINGVFTGFIHGKILDAAVVSVICYVGMMIFHWITPNKNLMSEILVAVIVGIFNVIPFFGWYIGLFLSALLILIVNPVQCIYFVIFDFILQQIDGNIIGPKILGNTTGISSLWVLFSIFLFGDIWGFAGMLIGVPLFAVIYHIITNLVFAGLERRGQSELADEYREDYPDRDTIKQAKEAAKQARKEEYQARREERQREREREKEREKAKNKDKI
jgi:predicted PurR-regulated permease PerM